MKLSTVCKICEKQCQNLKSLHLHLKAHKTSVEQYYKTYYPKYDLYTHHPIKFKTFEHYFSSDFNSRESFSKWCRFHENKEEIKDLVRRNIVKRKEEKGINKFPCQVELKSLMIPTIHGIRNIFGENWRREIENLGLIINFDYDNNPVFSEGELKIYQDTREQYPLHFDNKEVMKLSAGDYTCAGEFYSDVFVERKSLYDLVGTLSSNVDRFQREIERAAQLEYYIVVVIDAEYDELLNYTPKNSFSSIVTGKHIFYQIRNLISLYNNIQFVFSGNRKRSVEIIEKIFRMKSEVKKFDLEYLKDGGKL